jgi:two-component system sensor histidine kinase KdpD
MLRSALANEARNASWLSEADRFQKTLLNSIAHNVRTPLASIIGVLSTLEEDDAALNATVRRDLVETARQEADRLNRLLGNLLDLSRIEARAVRVRADPCDVQDVIGAAIEQLGGRARDRSIDVQIDSNMPLVHMDFVLIVQVLVNLLDNAMKYSTSEAPIRVRAALADGTLELRVEDCGDGLAEEDLKNVFDKFNRAGRTGETGGIGLGLSICKGLVEAHRGRIWAERRCPHGTAVALRLPLSPGGIDDGQHHARTCS